jgi:hypothetical protein
MRRVLAVLVVLSFAMMPGVGALAATECNGTISGSISGGLVVNNGDVCDLEDATISGGVHMSGGRLQACSSTISGGFIATGGNCVILGKMTEEDSIPCGGDTINGGVNLTNVSGASCGIENVEIQFSHITGGVQLKNNGVEGDVELEGNTISGGLHCSGNNGITFDFLHNTVTGGESGQCVGF